MSRADNMIYSNVLDDFFQEVKQNLLLCMDANLKNKVTLNRVILTNIFGFILSNGTNIPIILVGKPGTSKTLAVTVFESVFN